jgi:hypothetical protein
MAVTPEPRDVYVADRIGSRERSGPVVTDERTYSGFASSAEAYAFAAQLRKRPPLYRDIPAGAKEGSRGR